MLDSDIGVDPRFQDIKILFFFPASGMLLDIITEFSGQEGY